MNKNREEKTKNFSLPFNLGEQKISMYKEILLFSFLYSLDLYIILMHDKKRIFSGFFMSFFSRAHFGFFFRTLQIRSKVVKFNFPHHSTYI